VRTPISPFPQRIRGRGRSSIRNLLFGSDLPHSAPLPALCLSPACLQFVKSATVVSATIVPLVAVSIRIFHSNRALISQFRGSFPCPPSPCAKQRRRTPPQNHRPGRQADQGFLADGGIKPTLSVDVSPGLEPYKKEKRPLRLPRLPGDVEDLIRGSTLRLWWPLLRQRHRPAQKLIRPPRCHLLTVGDDVARGFTWARATRPRAGGTSFSPPA